MGSADSVTRDGVAECHIAVSSACSVLQWLICVCISPCPPSAAVTPSSPTKSLATAPTSCCLHPFPLNRHFWDPVAAQLSTRYRLIIPDLRAHGESELGEGPATMQKLADDLFAAVPRGEHQPRLSSSVCPSGAICSSNSGVDTATRLQHWFWRIPARQPRLPRAKRTGLRSRRKYCAKEQPAFIEEMLPKLIVRDDSPNRPDIVDAARR